MNDVTTRLRARPAINLVVTNNIGRLCWPPAQLSGHLDFFQNKCGDCKYRSAGLQEASMQSKLSLTRFFRSPTTESLGRGCIWSVSPLFIGAIPAEDYLVSVRLMCLGEMLRVIEPMNSD